MFTYIAMFLETCDKVVGGFTLVKEKRLSQFFRYLYMMLEAANLIFSCREHPVIIKSALAYCNYLFVTRNYLAYTLKVL